MHQAQQNILLQVFRAKVTPSYVFPWPSMKYEFLSLSKSLGTATINWFPSKDYFSRVWTWAETTLCSENSLWSKQGKEGIDGSLQGNPASYDRKQLHWVKRYTRNKGKQASLSANCQSQKHLQRHGNGSRFLSISPPTSHQATCTAKAVVCQPAKAHHSSRLEGKAGTQHFGKAAHLVYRR